MPSPAEMAIRFAGFAGIDHALQLVGAKREHYAACTFGVAGAVEPYGLDGESLAIHVAR